MSKIATHKQRKQAKRKMKNQFLVSPVESLSHIRGILKSRQTYIEIVFDVHFLRRNQILYDRNTG